MIIKSFIFILLNTWTVSFRHSGLISGSQAHFSTQWNFGVGRDGRLLRWTRLRDRTPVHAIGRRAAHRAESAEPPGGRQDACGAGGALRTTAARCPDILRAVGRRCSATGRPCPGFDHTASPNSGAECPGTTVHSCTRCSPSRLVSGTMEAAISPHPKIPLS